MPKDLGLLLSLVVALFAAAPSSAATYTLFASASGDPNPPELNQPSYQNGDFLVVRCCGASVINDATDEYVSWALDLSGQVPGPVTKVKSASLQLQFRAGDDSPWNDELYVANSVLRSTRVSVYGGVVNNATYDLSFDLLALLGEARLIALLNSDPLLNFSTSNDTLTYGAQLRTTVVAGEVPLPASGLLLAGALAAAAVAGGFRRRPDQ